MLLLSLGFIKDAARAVKRICQEEFIKAKDLSRKTSCDPRVMMKRK